MHCTRATIGDASASRLRQGPARRGARSQRRPVAPRAGLLDTLIKPITSSGEVGRLVPSADDTRLLPPPPPVAMSACWLSLQGQPLPRSLLCALLQRKPLKEGIANFYDESSQLWESIWVRSRLLRCRCVLCVRGRLL